MPFAPEHLSRRHLFAKGLAFTTGFLGLQRLVHAQPMSRRARRRNEPTVRGLWESPGRLGYGELIKDPHRTLDLPKGFSYTVISRVGDEMDDGLLVPGLPDGMAAFPGRGGRTIIVRNHEVAASSVSSGAFGPRLERLSSAVRGKLYDAGGGRVPSLGGTTTLVFNTRTGEVERQFMSLAGTNLNCSGGPTPWGSWLTCEEDEVRAGEGDAEVNHGYVFEVPAREIVMLEPPRPIKAMGRFRHEAVAVDPATSIVYLTEDKEDGLLYRFIPDRRAPRAGERAELLAGGKLQALALRDHASWNTNNHGLAPGVPNPTQFPRGVALATAWMDLAEIDSPRNDLRHRGFAGGAARFARGEGMWWANQSDFGVTSGCAYFACTTGGVAKKGQIFRYTPSPHEGDLLKERDKPGMLELFVEPNDGHMVENADNLTVAPWGDLLVCEDGVDAQVEKGNRLLGITPAGVPYTFARNALSGSEFSGVHFSPDGSTLFVNLQGNGTTLAVRGPWRKASKNHAALGE